VAIWSLEKLVNLHFFPAWWIITTKPSSDLKKSWRSISISIQRQLLKWISRLENLEYHSLQRPDSNCFEFSGRANALQEQVNNISSFNLLAYWKTYRRISTGWQREIRYGSSVLDRTFPKDSGLWNTEKALQQIGILIYVEEDFPLFIPNLVRTTVLTILTGVQLLWNSKSLTMTLKSAFILRNAQKKSGASRAKGKWKVCFSIGNRAEAKTNKLFCKKLCRR